MSDPRPEPPPLDEHAGALATGPEGIVLPPPGPEEAKVDPSVTRAAALSTTLNPRLAPQDVDAERSVLGGIMLENEKLFDVMEIVQENDFYREPHRTIFKAMCELASRNEPIDVRILGSELIKMGQLEQVGGPSYIGNLDAFVPSTANLGNYATIIRDCARDRRRIEAAHAVAREGYERLGKIDDRDASAERQILAATQTLEAGEGLVRVSKTLNTVYATIESIADKGQPITGLRTNLPRLDRMTTGFQPGQLIYVLGQAGSGKTSLLMDFLIASAVTAGLPTLSFCMEMSREEMVSRMIASVGNVNHQRMRSGTLKPYEWQLMAVAADKIHKAPLYIDDTPAQTIMALRGKSVRAKTKHGKLGMIGVDYAQLMSGMGEDTREQEINTISRGLKRLAREMQCPVVALSQMNRGVVKRDDKRPAIGDARDSGAIDQDCDIMLGAYRPTMYYPDADKEDAEIGVIKQRAGPTGPVHAKFKREFFRFDPPPVEPGEQEEFPQ